MRDGYPIETGNVLQPQGKVFTQEKTSYKARKNQVRVHQGTRGEKDLDARVSTWYNALH